MFALMIRAEKDHVGSLFPTASYFADEFAVMLDLKSTARPFRDLGNF